jgi:alkylation response protein AidB-like acyl-CoA dehydrogenase
VDFLEPAEHRDLRAAVGAVTNAFGPKYFAERSAAGEPTTELWQKLADNGFIGINLPEEFGAGAPGWPNSPSSARRPPPTAARCCYAVGVRGLLRE